MSFCESRHYVNCTLYLCFIFASRGFPFVFKDVLTCLCFDANNYLHGWVHIGEYIIPPGVSAHHFH